MIQSPEFILPVYVSQ